MFQHPNDAMLFDCPFCPDGGDPRARAVSHIAAAETAYFVECYACGGRTGFYAVLSDAVNAWGLRDEGVTRAYINGTDYPPSTDPEDKQR